MQHPDEGTLHAWLDGELAPDEVPALRAHVEGCAACAALIREARQLVADSNDLILALDEPAAAGQTSETIPTGRGAPVVLLPYHERLAQRGGSWRRVMAVAATVTVAAGASWLAFRSKAPEVRTASNILSSAPVSGAATTAAAPARDSQAVANPATAPVTALRQDSSTGAAEVATQNPAVPRAAASKIVIAPMEPRTDVAHPAATAALRRPAPQPLAEVRAEPATEPAPLLAADAPPITSRIGLDEAREQLGGNLHVIDGLQPEMVGLVPGRLVPGADSSRPVVRVVYLDADGHSFFLDQQRVTSASAAGALMARMASVPGEWRAGDVQLRLHGAIPKDSLARLQRRVR